MFDVCLVRDVSGHWLRSLFHALSDSLTSCVAQNPKTALAFEDDLNPLVYEMKLILFCIY
jgi:hypothetical protein